MSHDGETGYACLRKVACLDYSTHSHGCGRTKGHKGECNGQQACGPWSINWKSDPTLRAQYDAYWAAWKPPTLDPRDRFDAPRRTTDA